MKRLYNITLILLLLLFASAGASAQIRGVITDSLTHEPLMYITVQYEGKGVGGMYSISVENQPYPVLCTLSPNGCTTHVPDFPKIATQAASLDAALLEVKQQIQKALRQYKNPPIPTKQDQIVVPNNSVLVLVKAG